MENRNSIIDKDKVKSSKSFFRAILKRISLITLSILCLFLLVIWKLNNSYTQSLRTSIIDLSYPILSGVTSIIDSYYSTIEYSQIFFDIKDEHKKQKRKIELLQGKIDFLKNLEKENMQLKKLLSFVKDSEYLFKSARVIGSSNNSFVRSILINIGSIDDVRTGQAVVNHYGVVGRIVEVGKNYSRVLLVSDYSSKIPVIGASSREHAILYGQNEQFLKLSFYEKNHDFEIGETILTSGDGQLFPPGYPIATIIDIEEGRVLAIPLIKWSLIDFVSVLSKP